MRVKEQHINSEEFQDLLSSPIPSHSPLSSSQSQNMSRSKSNSISLMPPLPLPLPLASTSLSVAPSPRLSSPSSADPNRLFIIGAGLSRTGTDTMSVAMEILLNGGSAYHGGKMIAVKGILHEGVLWNAGGHPDFDRIFDTRRDGVVYNATFDVPGNNFVKELMDRYPNYRVILTKRKSAEEWADSMMNTMIPVIQYLRILDKLLFGSVDAIHRAIKFSDHFFPGNFMQLTAETANREKLVQVYNSHLENIRKLVPADRLIEFHPGDGWEPLCKGLNLPIPSVPFPRKNERSGFQWRTVWTCSKSFMRNHSVETFCFLVAMIFFLYVMFLQLMQMFH